MVADHNGRAMLKAVEGESRTVTIVAGVLAIADAKGDMARVTTPDVIRSNGVIRVIDRVLLPGWLDQGRLATRWIDGVDRSSRRAGARIGIGPPAGSACRPPYRQR